MSSTRSGSILLALALALCASTAIAQSVTARLEPAEAAPAIPVALVLDVENTTGETLPIPRIFTVVVKGPDGEEFRPGVGSRTLRIPQEYADADLVIASGASRHLHIPLGLFAGEEVFADRRLHHDGPYGFTFVFDERVDGSSDEEPRAIPLDPALVVRHLPFTVSSTEEERRLFDRVMEVTGGLGFQNLTNSQAEALRKEFPLETRGSYRVDLEVRGTRGSSSPEERIRRIQAIMALEPRHALMDLYRAGLAQSEASLAHEFLSTSELRAAERMLRAVELFREARELATTDYGRRYAARIEGELRARLQGIFEEVDRLAAKRRE